MARERLSSRRRLPEGTRARHLLAEVAAEEGISRRVEGRVEVGLPSERLAEVADEEAAEFIVVGTRGRGTLKSALLGSVSSELVGLSPCPVLAVPPGAAGHASA